MGTISSGIGMISGINFEEIVGQLMELEKKPLNQVKGQLENSVAEQEALMKIQALVLSLQVSVSSFDEENIFNQKSVTSSNEDVIRASVTRFAEPGTHAFTVRQRAANHTFITRQSYKDLNSNVGTGTLSFEMGQGQLNRATHVNFINGQQGFQRGKISIMDRSGATSEIDLTEAITMQDIIDEINKNSDINVKAGVSGDSLTLDDLSGGAGKLQVFEVGDGTAARDLGLTESVALSAEEGKITGADLMYIAENTLLSDLNDGNGLRGIDTSLDDIRITPTFGPAFEIDLKSTMSQTIGNDSQSTLLKALNRGAGIRAGEFRITDQNGKFIEVDLNELGENATAAQLEKFIEQKAVDNGMKLDVSFANQDHFDIRDNSTPITNPADPDDTSRRSHFIIEDLNGGHAAADLGIVADTTSSSVEGDKVWFLETVGDVINAVNNHWANSLGHIQMEIDAEGNGLTLTDNSGPGSAPKIEALNDSHLLEDLGLENAAADGNSIQGTRLIAGLNTVMLSSLNGGTGGDPDAEDYGRNRITGGEQLFLKDKSMAEAVEVDLDGVATMQDMLERINNAGTGIRARINDAGNGLVLSDASGGSGTMDVSGTMAEKLNLAGSSSEESINSGNLQLQYINEAARLDDMRQGQGIYRGTFSITDGNGKNSTINISDGMNTLEDVINAINRSGSSVRARINDTGDGLLLFDTAENPAQAFSVSEFGNGSTAGDLGILGEALKDDNDQFILDGSFEFKMDVTAGDSIEDIARYVNDANIGIKAALINDGRGYRLNFESQVAGAAGMVYLDAGGTNMNTQTVTRGQDAKVFLGNGNNAHPVMITSSSNTIKDVVKGVTLDLVAASDQPVVINVDQDTEGIKKQMNNFVTAYNKLMDEISKVTKFNSDTFERGILFSDHTVNRVKSTVQSMILHSVPNMGGFNRLSDIGISFASLGTETVTDENGEAVQTVVATIPKLKFDEARFNAAFTADAEGVSELFTKADVGLGDYVADLLKGLGDTYESTIQNRLDSMQNSQKLYEGRIEQLNDLLTAKENRLYKEFYAMESALASLQNQQSALSSLSSLAMPATSAG